MVGVDSGAFIQGNALIDNDKFGSRKSFAGQCLTACNPVNVIYAKTEHKSLNEVRGYLVSQSDRKTGTGAKIQPRSRYDRE